ncbi:MAG: SDR family oxidoreductase [SAR202 cluster bacterium]|nr:SDR family oxidoreductase [SAR202 cluster bacterium]|tara:strand:- start:9497 stop:10294 length:798 start_codon:yes stop_codon:yes gene_type:complete
MDLTNKIAIVTGGGQGIGKGICEILSKNGAIVIVTDINLDSAKLVSNKISSKNSNSTAYQLDVTKNIDTFSVTKEIFEQFGKIDILVNNAGIVAAPNWEEAQKLTEEDWDLTYQVNLRGLAKMTESTIRYMKDARYGKIINIASVAGRIGGTFHPPYSATKAGVINYTQSMSVILAKFNININTICPGHVWTELAHRTSMNQKIAEGEQHNSLRKVFENNVKTWVPLKREQQPRDIGYLAAFLASDYSKNITGQAINIDGGIYMN